MGAASTIDELPVISLGSGKKPSAEIVTFLRETVAALERVPQEQRSRAICGLLVSLAMGHAEPFEVGDHIVTSFAGALRQAVYEFTPDSTTAH